MKKTTLKKFVALAMCATMCVSMAVGCGKKEETTAEKGGKQQLVVVNQLDEVENTKAQSLKKNIQISK